MAQSKQTIPSLMQIMTAAAKAANLTICNLMGKDRKKSLITVRAAFYKVASDYGYQKNEIMECIDRNRTVGYNYDANIKGHLLEDAFFKALCALTEEKLTEYPHRVFETPQQREKRQKRTIERAEQEPQTPEPSQEERKESIFTDYKSPLGWFFTADEMRRAYYACRKAERWFENTYHHRKRWNPDSHEGMSRTPKEMDTHDAAIYLDISVSLLVKGVKLGQLTRFKKANDSHYWYHTSDLDRYKQYLTNMKRKKRR